jgi:gliding motility-associated-like protein
VNGGDIIDGNGTHKITVNWKKQPGFYKMSVVETNSMGCSGDIQEGVVWIRGAQFSTNYPDKACLFDSVSIKASGGLFYQWSNGLTDSIIRIKLMGDTILKVHISDTVCGQNTDSFDITIKASSKPILSVTTEMNSVFKNQPINISYNGNPSDRIRWDINKPYVRSAIGQGITLRFLDTGEAVVKVISTNLLGCTDSSLLSIEILDEQLYFPSAFTPDGDGLNEIFKPGGLSISEYQLRIFNRWGEMIFCSDTHTPGWDGTMNGSPAQQDVYVYLCETTGKSGRKYTYTGNITLIR